MSKIKIQGNASGTGVVTLTAPNTNLDRTITLPDSTGTVLMTDGDGSSLTGTGKVLQVAQSESQGVFYTSATSFVDTGLVTVSFSNNLSSGSKVLVSIEATIGESYTSGWAQPTFLTVYDTVQGANIGDSSYGIVGGNAIAGVTNQWNQYDMARLMGSKLYTPTGTAPIYKLYLRSGYPGTSRGIGRAYSNNTNYDVAGTRITIMEIGA
jgi:hypothetical protein